MDADKARMILAKIRQKAANDAIQLRPGDPGLGVPPQIPRSVTPLTDAERSLLATPASSASAVSRAAAPAAKLPGLLAALKKLGTGGAARGAGMLGVAGLAGAISGRATAAAQPQPQPKQAADPAGDAFASALQNAHASALKQDAMGDVVRIGGTALAAGAGARGLLGLIRMLRENSAPKKTRSGPITLPLPYPAEPKMASYLSDVLGGNLAADKSGIPAYMPAAALAGVAGLGLGYKGLDSLLASRRKAEQAEELDRARSEFHDALIGQYKKPIATHPALMSKKSSDSVGAALDAAYDVFAEQFEKASLDLSNLAGQAAGGYGVYAGLSGLLAGALAYDKIQKRGRGAVLQKALQRRQRRQFTQAPTEIYATPEPMPVGAPEEEEATVPALRG